MPDRLDATPTPSPAAIAQAFEIPVATVRERAVDLAHKRVGEAIEALNRGLVVDAADLLHRAEWLLAAARGRRS